MSEYEGRTFKCQQCRGEYYELTERFEPVPPMRGNYVRLLQRYGVGGYNWYDFPHNEWTIGDNVACVNCGCPIRMEYVVKNLNKAVNDEQKASEDCAETGGVLRDGVSAVDSGNLLCSVRDNVGLYDDSELGDNLLNQVLQMTARGKTQTDIAETCGISVYRVRKLQNGEIS